MLVSVCEFLFSYHLPHPYGCVHRIIQYKRSMELNTICHALGQLILSEMLLRFQYVFFFVYFCFWDGNELPFIRSVFVYMSAFYWSGFSRRFQFSIVGDFALLMRTIQWHCELLGGTEYECTVRKKTTRQTRLGWQQQAASNAVVDYVLTTCAAAHQIHKPLLGRLFLCGCVDCCLIEK